VSLFVLDASVALAWFIDRPIHAYAIQVRERIASGESSIVPGLWETEFANGVLMAERRKLMTEVESAECMTEMQQLRASRIELDSGFRDVRDVLSLARTFRLTLYDACYLELANRLKLPLATLDKHLR
jgi:predicted nucleic acid-binding protein